MFIFFNLCYVIDLYSFIFLLRPGGNIYGTLHLILCVHLLYFYNYYVIIICNFIVIIYLFYDIVLQCILCLGSSFSLWTV